MSDTGIDNGDFEDEADGEEFSPELLEQIQRLRLNIDQAEQQRLEKRNRAYRMRRRIEEWSDHRMLFDGIDYLDKDPENDHRKSR